MVDEQGRKTPIYDIVSRANEHLHAVGDILSESNFCGIQVFGESPIEVPKTDLERGSMIENISGGNFLCGKLERGGKEVDYIVNLSIENAAEAQIKFADTREHSFCVGDKTGVACGGVRIPLKAGEGALVY
jgi:hypothetical protein